MAKHITQKLTIQVSKLVRDSESARDLLEPAIIESIEAVISELVGEGVLVEVSVE